MPAAILKGIQRAETEQAVQWFLGLMAGIVFAVSITEKGVSVHAFCSSSAMQVMIA
jgi:hypothetical protein